jgi:hypothetical protein
MSKEIKFKKTTTFLGRNGEFKTSAILVCSPLTNNGENVRIRPITSKNEIGRCFIDIPKTNVQELIDELKNLL